MHRIDTPSATENNRFTEGSPTGGVPATVVSASWLNDLQETICRAIELSGITLEKGNSDQLYQALQSISGLPAGILLPYAGNGPMPARTMKANGATNVSRSTYAALFAAIGTTFGAGDGSTTFGIPDMRGVVPRGMDEGRGLDAGRALGTYQRGTLTMMDKAAGFGVQGMRSPDAQYDNPGVFYADAAIASNYPNVVEVGVTGTGAALGANSVLGKTRMDNLSTYYVITF